MIKQYVGGDKRTIAIIPFQTPLRRMPAGRYCSPYSSLNSRGGRWQIDFRSDSPSPPRKSVGPPLLLGQLVDRC